MSETEGKKAECVRNNNWIDILVKIKLKRERKCYWKKLDRKRVKVRKRERKSKEKKEGERDMRRKVYIVERRKSERK